MSSFESANENCFSYDFYEAYTNYAHHQNSILLYKATSQNRSFLRLIPQPIYRTRTTLKVLSHISSLNQLISQRKYDEWRKLKYEWLRPEDFTDKDTLQLAVWQALRKGGNTLNIAFSAFKTTQNNLT